MRLFVYPLIIVIFIVLSGSTKPDNKLFPFYEGKLWVELFEKDTLESGDVYLAKDSLQRSLFYYSNIVTPVCYDNTCKPLYLTLYWDICGSFLGFKVPEEHPLTKKDHKPFSNRDYYSLYTILNNPNASISKMNKTDLVNYNVTSDLDAISGATSAEAQQMVIPGAAYSTYTLWHLVYNTRLGKDKENSYPEMKDWKQKLKSVDTLSADELAIVLNEADKNKQLRKYQIQQMLVSQLKKMPVINALLVNNYLRRQPFLATDIEEILKKCKSIQVVFGKMLPEKELVDTASKD